MICQSIKSYGESWYAAISRLLFFESGTSRKTDDCYGKGKLVCRAERRKYTMHRRLS